MTIPPRDALTDALTDTLDAACRAGRVPNLALTVVRGGRALYSRGFGVTNAAEGGAPVTPDTLFRIGSTTKPLTALAALRLARAGALDLDAPLRGAVPEWPPEAAGAPITPRALLTHTSGLPDLEELHGPRDPDALERHVLGTVARLPRAAPVGAAFGYSGAGYDALGLAVQRAARRPFADAVRDLVLRPLGMHRTTFDPLEAVTRAFAHEHRLDPDGALRPPARLAENAAHAPSGMAWSCTADLARLAAALLDPPGGETGLTAALVDELWRPAVPMGGGAAYGLGFVVETDRGERRVKHGGMVGAYGSLFVLLPERRLGFSLLYGRTDDLSLNDLEASVCDVLRGAPPA